MVPVFSSLLAVSALAALANAQASDGTPDAHPSLTTYKCTTAGGCTAQDTSVVIDWNYHWIHTADYLSCTTSTGVNATLCPDEATCAQNCMIAGDTTYNTSGVSTSGDSLTMYQYVETDGAYSSASPRLYLLGADGNYEDLQLLGQELTFTVDLSTLPCGENGALYLSEMDFSGGSNQYTPDGAGFGAGYCDAQCPVQTWKNGTLNPAGDKYCCNEMDILEANSRALAFTPHPCLDDDSACDPNGCGYNPYAAGYKSYYGPGMTVDTSKPFTVVTQFITDDGTTTGTLSQITRKYVQNGVVVPSANPAGDTLTLDTCNAMDDLAETYGSLTTMGEALGRGMVLIFSIWNDASGFMNWLDSGDVGPCNATEGDPTLIIQNDPTTHVVFSNIRWGDIGSTFNSGNSSITTTSSATPTFSTTTVPSNTTTTATTTSSVPTTTSTTTSASPTTTSSSSTTTTTAVPTTTTTMSTTTPQTTATTTTTSVGATQTHWGQCAGMGYTGPTVCESGYTCTYSNDYYSQCL